MQNGKNRGDTGERNGKAGPCESESPQTRNDVEGTMGVVGRLCGAQQQE